MNNLKEKIDKLEYAKKAVQAILNDSECLVDFKGLTYWAGLVEKLRKEIKSTL